MVIIRIISSYQFFILKVLVLISLLLFQIFHSSSFFSFLFLLQIYLILIINFISPILSIIIPSPNLMLANSRIQKPSNIHPRCLSTNSAQKITNKLNSRDPIQSKKHCPQDQACFHCCQCWIKFKDEYNKRTKYLQAKISDDHQEITLLKNCMQKMAKENLDLKKKVRNTTDFETIKQNLKEQLRKEIDDEIKANDLIQKQKIISLTEKNDQNYATIALLNQQVCELGKQIKELSDKLDIKEVRCKQLQIKLKQEVGKRIKVQQKNKQLQKEIQNLNTQIITLRNALKQKDLNISEMKSTLDHTDRLISIKSSELTEKDFEKTKIQLQSSYKSQVLQKIQKINQQHSKSISQLETDKSKLNQLVGSLKQELITTDTHKHILKMALGDAESVSMEKSFKLENLKHDVRMLKYTLPETLKASKFFLED